MGPVILCDDSRCSSICCPAYSKDFLEAVPPCRPAPHPWCRFQAEPRNARSEKGDQAYGSMLWLAFRETVHFDDDDDDDDAPPLSHTTANIQSAAQDRPHTTTAYPACVAQAASSGAR
jgi:hypothetical protein